MSVKPKVAFYWCASCGGCEETVVDLQEALIDVASKIDIVLWPVALDFKYSDVEALADGEIAVSFINGAIRTSEQEHIAKLLRRKSGLVIAFGACAMSGGIPALANLTTRKEIFRRSYLQSPTVRTRKKLVPSGLKTKNGVELPLPEFYETVHTLSDVVEVDYSIPGCPPTSDLLAGAVGKILSGDLPKRGEVLAPKVALCSSCDRNDSKPEELTLEKLRRVVDTIVDPDLCFLAQGLLCMGPATRDGCGQSCINGNMPCSGCFGPTDACRDQGGKMIATLGGLLTAEGEDLDKALEALVDPAGTFYRYGMASSMLGAARKDGSK